MGKKVVSFSLEEDIIDFIKNYQKELNLSSASAVLERIILEKKIKQNLLEEFSLDIKDLVEKRENLKENSEENINNEFKIKNKMLVNNIDDSFSQLK
ncbi:hypothetical protein [Clostridium perfringens]|uniref:30S ribosomal protein S3 n=1 Tax=Clostridium perfringens B str. ATCC 3626 TaxID=451754 RepID=A0AAV3BLH6_CLOPF|nr:hypothetical protein [Clostridium perfringens]EDT23165.1 30S ribosomal protein S3 [Clostridium perfringens B str. ATCC 3626]ELC8450755.1 hypothetical protein [Clostridium perfringens]MBI6029677.1 hypothetical protein [Clostridium perfringens]MBI6032970.1 hypothetical protein [Clostridium perfringens]MCX0356184.1 hypothetical protein [Clostridium perfringens]